MSNTVVDIRVLEARWDGVSKTKPEDYLDDQTCGAAPTQFKGNVDGAAYYFRYRWGKWQLAIAETNDAAVAATADCHAPRFYYAEGYHRHPDAPGASACVAWLAATIIHHSVETWRHFRLDNSADE